MNSEYTQEIPVTAAVSSACVYKKACPSPLLPELISVVRQWALEDWAGGDEQRGAAEVSFGILEERIFCIYIVRKTVASFPTSRMLQRYF